MSVERAVRRAPDAGWLRRASLAALGAAVLLAAAGACRGEGGGGSVASDAGASAGAAATGAAAAERDGGASGERGAPAPGDAGVSGSQAAAEGRGPPWSYFDVDAILAELEGRWRVRDRFGMDEPVVWAIDGDRLRRVDGDETQRYRIEVRYPGRLAITDEAAGTTRHLAFARGEDTLYVGLGEGGMRIDGRYLVADSGLVVYDGERCRFYDASRGIGDDAPELAAPMEVRCRVASEGDRRELHYRVPARTTDGEMSDEKVRILGRALVDRQLHDDHRAERIDDDGSD